MKGAMFRKYSLIKMWKAGTFYNSSKIIKSEKLFLIIVYFIKQLLMWNLSRYKYRCMCILDSHTRKLKRE